jgi:hypothetical protein
MGILKLHLARYELIVILGVLLSACGTAQPVQPSLPPPSPTPDPCNTENISTTARLVNDYMRQFDDYSVLASNIVQSQMVLVIPPMQEIRRDAEDQEIPSCLGELKRLELLYMDSTLQALLAFQTSSNVETLTAAILQSRQYHEQYALELARVLGVTLTASAPAPTAITTP